MSKKLLCILLCLGLMLSLNSCAGSVSSDNKLSVVCTIFPGYDFAREILDGIDDIELTMLLKPGSETHSYEPTPQNIIAIQNCDVFIYTGGESDEWIKNILASIDTTDIKLISMMDCVDALEEETVEGMEEAESEKSSPYEPEYDEHVWTSPLNAIKIVQKISESLYEILDDEPRMRCAQNTESYIKQLAELDQRFRDITENGARRTIVFGDRFPFRYFADEYGLEYYAAFPGCSSETEASARTVSFLIDKVNNDNIPVVFYIEMSNQKIVDTICSSTGAKAMRMSSCHNVTADEFKSGVTYLRLMEENAEALKAALN